MLYMKMIFWSLQLCGMRKMAIMQHTCSLVNPDVFGKEGNRALLVAHFEAQVVQLLQITYNMPSQL